MIRCGKSQGTVENAVGGNADYVRQASTPRQNRISRRGTQSSRASGSPDYWNVTAICFDCWIAPEVPVTVTV